MTLRSLLLAATLALTACGSTGQDTTPPTVEFLSLPSTINPRSDVRIRATDDSAIASVQLHAKSPAGDRLLGETGVFPYSIQPNTRAFPNLTRIEVYATVTDTAGNRTRTAPVAVQIADGQAAQLSYYAGFTYPSTAVTTQSSRSAPTTWNLSPETVRPPLEQPSAVQVAVNLAPQAANRVRAVEWGWLPITDALGYTLYRSSDALTPFTRVRGIQQSPGNPLIRQAEFLTAGEPATSMGVMTALGSTGESAYSNTMAAQFLPEQELVSPQDQETAIGGRPTLTWAPNSDPSARGYLFFVYTNNPEQTRARPIWSSENGQTTARTNAVYPATADPLPPGTYYWRVAAVSFTAQGVASGFSYSVVRRFQVQP